ncbi:MAG: DUF177 domain-containing protein [Pseudomonadota bacterium]
MKINVMNIPEEGLKVQFSKDENWSRQIFKEKEKMGLTLGRIDGSVFLKRIRQTLYLEGDLRTQAETVCSRCLDAACLPINASFKYVLSPAQTEHTEERELSPEDLDFVYYQDDLIDLDPLIIEQVLLQIPMKVLCREDCKGLCPHCGIDLNQNHCQCHDEHIDSRLAILKKLKA